VTEGSRAKDRVRALVRAAQRIADPNDPLGREARPLLVASTGLSAEGVELALAECLETHPSEDDIERLASSVTPAPRAHVVLSASVFVAAHRAIALGLASSVSVFVKPSRRDPAMSHLLARAAPGLFHIVDRLDASSGDVVFAYGSDDALGAVRSALPDGVRFEAHGTGIGVCVLELDTDAASEELERLARAVASDVVPFDQFGCLSPRVVLVVGSEVETERFASSLAQALSDAEVRVPRGRIPDDVAVAAARYRDAMTVAAAVLPAGFGCVGVAREAGIGVIPPPGRNIHVARVIDMGRTVESLRQWVTVFGVAGSAALAGQLAELAPGARRVRPGFMQRPAFDGPVDLRHKRRESGELRHLPY
jgi:hypothetical protein